MTAPATPASRPTIAPSSRRSGVGVFCWSMYAATAPPLSTHRQQQTLPAEMMGSAVSTPITSPPTSAGCARRSVVVLTAQVGDELFALQITQSVFELHQLDEQIVLWIDGGRMHRTLEVERQPLLDAAHVRALGQIEQQRHIEHDGCRQDAVAAQEVDLELHRIAEPPEQIDVVPAFLVVAARRIVVDPDHVAEVPIQI